MADPARVLKKILGDSWDAEKFKATGESQALLVDTLRDLIRCRRSAAWLEEHAGLHSRLEPHAFHALLDIPEINYTEVTDRNLEVTQHSLKELRRPDDAVTVSNLNTVLRELFRDLNALHQLQIKEYPRRLLAGEISGDLVERAEEAVLRLRGLDWRGVGFLLTGLWARAAEREFETLFPKAARVHPLRRSLDAVQVELGFYHRCLEINIKWAATGLDLFGVIRAGALAQVVENLTALGSGLWNVIYNGLQLPQSMQLCGLDFSNVETLLDEEKVPLSQGKGLCRALRPGDKKAHRRAHTVPLYEDGAGHKACRTDIKEGAVEGEAHDTAFGRETERH